MIHKLEFKFEVFLLLWVYEDRSANKKDDDNGGPSY